MRVALSFATLMMLACDSDAQEQTPPFDATVEGASKVDAATDSMDVAEAAPPLRASCRGKGTVAGDG